MSARLLPVIVVSMLLGSAVAFKDRMPDCSAIIDKATFDTYKHICAAVDTDNLVEYSNTNKWDIVETCTCNLLSHELAWSLMLTHEVDSMYVALIQLIDQLDSAKDAQVKVDRNSSIFASSSEGTRMYYWDRLDDIARQLKERKEFTSLASKFFKSLARVYYDPSNFEYKFDEQDDGDGLEANMMVSDTCKELKSNMFQFVKYFDRLRQLSGNDRYMFRVTSYNEDLHKIRMVMKYCQTMSIQRIVQE